MTRRYTVKAWSTLNVSTRYEGRSLLRAVYELWAARRCGFRPVALEVA